jgi:hypothetical protein
MKVWLFELQVADGRMLTSFWTYTVSDTPPDPGYGERMLAATGRRITLHISEVPLMSDELLIDALDQVEPPEEAFTMRQPLLEITEAETDPVVKHAASLFPPGGPYA